MDLLWPLRTWVRNAYRKPAAVHLPTRDCLLVCLFACLLVYLFFVCLFVCLLVFVCVCVLVSVLGVWTNACCAVVLSVHLSYCLFACASISAWVRLCLWVLLFGWFIVSVGCHVIAHCSSIMPIYVFGLWNAFARNPRISFPKSDSYGSVPSSEG